MAMPWGPSDLVLVTQPDLRAGAWGPGPRREPYSRGSQLPGTHGASARQGIMAETSRQLRRAAPCAACCPAPAPRSLATAVARSVERPLTTRKGALTGPRRSPPLSASGDPGVGLSLNSAMGQHLGEPAAPARTRNSRGGPWPEPRPWTGPVHAWPRPPRLRECEKPQPSWQQSEG